MNELLLKGLDGGSPIGFLAALGVLRASTLAWPERTVRLVWSDLYGGWRPRLSLRPGIDEDAWLEGLDRFLHDVSGHDAFQLADDLNVSIATFRKVALEAASRARPATRAPTARCAA